MEIHRNFNSKDSAKQVNHTAIYAAIQNHLTIRIIYYIPFAKLSRKLNPCNLTFFESCLQCQILSVIIDDILTHIQSLKKYLYG